MSIVVDQYNPEWPQHFQQIKVELEIYLAGVTYQSIEHVGSTSVPGLAAKPIIDIDIIVTRDNLQSAIDALITNGKFDYLGELGIADRHAFKDPNQSPPRNIYICVDGATQLRNHLGLRNTLRSNSELRDEYARVKLDLAAKNTNIIDYLEAKGAIIQKILKASGMLTAEEVGAIEKANVNRETWGALKTDRLLLREFVMMDIESYYELESNKENARYRSWPSRTMNQARELVLTNMRNACISPRTNWALVVEYEGNFVGRVGAALTVLDTGEQAQSSNHFDLWFSFLPSVQGKGFATEAMSAFIDELVKRQNGTPVELEIECDPRNTGSWRLAERLGFKKHTLTEGAWECKGELVDSLVYRRMM